MPLPESLRLRLQLLHKFEALAARLKDGDESALPEAVDVLQGISLSADCETMAMVFRGLVQTLRNMQPEIDRKRARF